MKNKWIGITDLFIVQICCLLITRSQPDLQVNVSSSFQVLDFVYCNKHIQIKKQTSFANMA